MSKIAIFDFDGTLLDGETIETIVKHDLEKLEKMRELNQKGLQGLVHFTTLYLEKIKLLKGISQEQVYKNLEGQKYMSGAKEIISFLHERDFRVIVMSGAFEEALHLGQKELGYDCYFGNSLIYDENNILTGEVIGPCMSMESKGELVRKIRCLYGDDLFIFAAGDGRNDISLFEESNVSVSYHSRCAQLRKMATKDLPNDKDWNDVIASWNY